MFALKSSAVSRAAVVAPRRQVRAGRAGRRGCCSICFLSVESISLSLTRFFEQGKPDIFPCLPSTERAGTDRDKMSCRKRKTSSAFCFSSARPPHPTTTTTTTGDARFRSLLTKNKKNSTETKNLVFFPRRRRRPRREGRRTHQCAGLRRADRGHPVS